MDAKRKLAEAIIHLGSSTMNIDQMVSVVCHTIYHTIPPRHLPPPAFSAQRSLVPTHHLPELSDQWQTTDGGALALALDLDLFSADDG